MAGKSDTKSKKASKKSGVERLKKELEEKDTQLKYLQADFENYRKAFERERDNMLKSANEGLMLKLLDVYENLERAVENGEEGQLLEGVQMIYDQMKSVMEGEGLRPIKAVGEKLDPFRHEAVMQEKDSDVEEGVIIEELQRGYMVGDRVIRYSKVKVSKR